MQIILKKCKEDGGQMGIFKVGDRVRIKCIGTSGDSRRYFGREFTITDGPRRRSDSDSREIFYVLNSPISNGVYELELVKKKIIKMYGIAKFCMENYKQ